jgi:hypothetical protein
LNSGAKLPIVAALQARTASMPASSEPSMTAAAYSSTMRAPSTCRSAVVIIDAKPNMGTRCHSVIAAAVAAAALSMARSNGVPRDFRIMSSCRVAGRVDIKRDAENKFRGEKGRHP